MALVPFGSPLVLVALRRRDLVESVELLLLLLVVGLERVPPVALRAPRIASPLRTLPVPSIGVRDWINPEDARLSGGGGLPRRCDAVRVVLDVERPLDVVADMLDPSEACLLMISCDDLFDRVITPSAVTSDGAIDGARLSFDRPTSRLSTSKSDAARV